jgi:hypothetical protein
MPETIRTTFDSKTNELIYKKQAEMIVDKKRKVTISEAIETLLKDAYLRKPKASH